MRCKVDLLAFELDWTHYLFLHIHLIIVDHYTLCRFRTKVKKYVVKDFVIQGQECKLLSFD